VREKCQLRKGKKILRKKLVGESPGERRRRDRLHDGNREKLFLKLKGGKFKNKKKEEQGQKFGKKPGRGEDPEREKLGKRKKVMQKGL